MLYRGAAAFALIVIVTLAAAPPAGAVLKGTSSRSLKGYTVRLVGNGSCSGVVIARRLVATARHCAYGMTVVAGHRYYRVAGVSRLGTLDDGRHVKATGDSSFLHLTKPLPETVAAVPIADGEAGDLGETFTIAGYGGGRLRQTSLVADSEYALVDPQRKGSTGASACFGDSGGPVIRGGWLVGVITRAAHPSPRRACGHLTRWAPITIASDAWVAAVTEKQQAARKAPAKRRARRSRPVRSKQAATVNWFGNWFASAKTKPRGGTARRR
jgi:secreted trypsin-like serine protease